MQVILTVAVPIFAVVLVGYLAGRFRILGGAATTALTAFVSFFALPVLFFGTLARTPVAQVLSLDLLIAYSLIMILTFGAGMLTTWLVTRGAPARRTKASGGLAAMSLQGIAASWGNVGYMGVPLCLAAFGPEGLPPAMLAVIVSSVVSMIFGVLLIELDVATHPGPFVAFLQAAWNVARNPLPMSIALGIAWSAIGVPMPLPLDKGIDLLGAAAAPCALFAIGLFLCDKSLRGGPVKPALAEAGLATVVKLLLQPALAVLLVPLFVDASSVGGKVLIVMAALPTAANAFVLAKQFEISVEQNTATVLLTTALSVITVSVVLVWLGIG
jgi:malonate transporter